MHSFGAAKIFAVTAMIGAALTVSNQPALADDTVLTTERLEKVQKLGGNLTGGVGLFCGYFDDAIPLKAAIIEVADKQKKWTKF